AGKDRTKFANDRERNDFWHIHFAAEFLQADAELKSHDHAGAGGGDEDERSGAHADLVDLINNEARIVRPAEHFFSDLFHEKSHSAKQLQNRHEAFFHGA